MTVSDWSGGRTASGALERADRVRAALADPIDRQMRPLGERVFAAIDPIAGEHVLDVGCGCGDTVVALADRVGPSGRVVGIDIGPHVLAVGRRRTAGLGQVTLVEADAGTLDLPDAAFDLIYSRFGVMFFADPPAAFRNFRRMSRPGGRIGFVCWRAAADNELDRFCLDAAGETIAVDSTPYSFETRSRIDAMLRSAGFSEITVIAHDQTVSAGDVETTLDVVLQVGALGRAIRDRPDLRPIVEPRVRDALARRATADAVFLGTATWIVTARR